jgi:peptide/nickel transport system permease protein
MSQRKQIILALVANRAGVIGAGLLVAIVVFCVLGPIVYTADPDAVDPALALSPPDGGHPLGTDQLGRDVLARLMKGGQVSLLIGLAAGMTATFLGVTWGVIASMSPRFVDAALMRFVDVLMSIPVLFFVLLLAASFRPTAFLLILVAALGSWLIPARLMRAESLSLLSRPYVEAAQGMAATRRRIFGLYLMPNSIGTIVVVLTFQIADAILLIAGLSFLGFGVPPPTASWGSMLSDSQDFIFQNAWWLIYPVGGMIFITVIAVNLIGDALRDSFEIRLQSR